MPRNAIACRVASYAPFEHLALAHLASLGVRYVEIPLPAAGQLDQTRAALDRHGLSASSVHGECDVRRADVADRVEAQMPAVTALGSRILFVSCKAEDVPLAEVYRRLRAAGDVAAAHGVTIAMETHPDLVTNGQVALATMTGVSHPNVRVNYDTANVYFYNRDIDGVAELRLIAGHVAAVHLKDTDGGYRHWHFPALGRGVVRFAEIFQVLDDAGFTGPLTLEIEGLEGEQKTEEMVCARIAESVEYLRRLVEKDSRPPFPH